MQILFSLKWLHNKSAYDGIQWHNMKRFQTLVFRVTVVVNSDTGMRQQ
jgi:hypothetical protein